MTERADPPPEGTPPTTIAEAIGGPLGALETAVPPVVFVVAYTASGQDTNTAAVVALALGAALAVARIARRQSPRHALGGLIGIAFAAFIATRSGKAENFFLPGLLANAAYGSAFLISLAIRRPLVGYIVGHLEGDPQGWKSDRIRRRALERATALWAALFFTRLAVQLPLYLAGAVVALGVARTAMGIPLFALGVWLTWLLVRKRDPEPAAA